MVKNKFPTIQSNHRIALIGEAPGKDEELKGEPFVGVSGRFLAALLSRAGVSREACFLGNISQYRPPNNDFSAFSWSGTEVQQGINSLRYDLNYFKPNIVVLLGNVPLKAAKDVSNNNTTKFRFSNANWRGSVFMCEDSASPMAGFKCIPSYHPAYCLRDYSMTPMLQFDLKKAVRHATPKMFIPPNRLFETGLSEEEILNYLAGLIVTRKTVAIDIEGYVNDMSCISFAINEGSAFIVPFHLRNGTSCDTWKVWKYLAMVLEDPNIPKILQNSLYDRFVLHYGYGIRVRGVVDDTMLKHWELYSELEKALGVQASIYTDEPYYKSDGKSDDDKTFFEYCCRDSAVTYEINSKLTPMLCKKSMDHYRLNVQLLNPLLYMEVRGIRYDVEGADKRRRQIREAMFKEQYGLNRLSGFGFVGKSVDEIKQRVYDLMWTKNRQRVYKSYLGTYERVKQILAEPPTETSIGELEDLCEVSLNVEAPKQIIQYLYETLKLPVQLTKKRNETPRPTVDYEALLNLAKIVNGKSTEKIIRQIIVLRALHTRESMLGISADSDNRIRCGYNIVGSNTGRLSCYESPTGSGYNLQTIPNYTNTSEAPGAVLGDRDLFLADDGYWFFQCDLSGADGWTVAAYSAFLGDPTMLDDYRAGISPFKRLTLKLRALEIPKDRNELREAVKVIGKDDWDRFAMKRVQHGGSYLEGAQTIARNILKDSEGKLVLSVAECQQMKDYFFQCYPGVKRWQDWIATRLKESPFLTAASGQRRQFFGRPDEILTKAVAFEPQANTTYATNLAMYRLWTDSSNRVNNNNNTHLRIEPLHQVHDALCGQFKKDDTVWASGKIKSYFDNTLVIAGIPIVIPYEGGYGPSWGNLNEGKL
jgi:DNA polymerase